MIIVSISVSNEKLKTPENCSQREYTLHSTNTFKPTILSLISAVCMPKKETVETRKVKIVTTLQLTNSSICHFHANLAVASFKTVCYTLCRIALNTETTLHSVLTEYILPLRKSNPRWVQHTYHIVRVWRLPTERCKFTKKCVFLSQPDGQAVSGAGNTSYVTGSWPTRLEPIAFDIFTGWMLTRKVAASLKFLLNSYHTAQRNFSKIAFHCLKLLNILTV